MGTDMTRREMLRNTGLMAGTLAALGATGVAAQQGQPAPAGALAQAAAQGQYTLPPLPYAYDALEPTLSEQILRLHHDKHHQGYVDGLNQALDQLQQVRSVGDAGTTRRLVQDTAFNGSGHVLHTVYWQSMKPNGGGRPSGTIAQMLDRDFGSYDDFVREFAAASKSVQGSGWGTLNFDPIGQRLMVFGVQVHEDKDMAGTVPLLVIDVWEHAYYLQYQNERGRYVDALIQNLLDWDSANQRLELAMRGGMQQPATPPAMPQPPMPQ